MEWTRKEITVLENKFDIAIKLKSIKHYKIYKTLKE